MTVPDIENSLKQYRRETTNQNDFVAKVDKLALTAGPIVIKRVFGMILGIEAELQDCEKYWSAALKHHRKLCEKMDREVDLTTSFSDYFINFTELLSNPRIIEADKYQDLVTKTITDKLTGLFNRRYFDEAYENQVGRALKYQDCFTVLFLDIDNFKMINDQYGHYAGDCVLQEIAEVIDDVKRDNDTAARYGGEEFVLLLTHTDKDKSLIFAERLRQRVASHSFTLNGETVQVTLSGGIASYPENSQDPQLLLPMADKAMYLAKGAGKNRISLYREENRRFQRIAVGEKIKIKKIDFENSEVFHGICQDISVSGANFTCSEIFEVGTLVQLEIILRKEKNPIIFIGKVVRVESTENGVYSIGVLSSFKEMDSSLTREVASILPHDSSP